MLFRNHVEELDQTAEPEISEPQAASMKTALLGGCHASDPRFEAIPSLSVGADVPDRGVAVIPAFTRGGSTV